jgi:hypothetical protein
LSGGNQDESQYPSQRRESLDRTASVDGVVIEFEAIVRAADDFRQHGVGSWNGLGLLEIIPYLGSMVLGK